MAAKCGHSMEAFILHTTDFLPGLLTGWKDQEICNHECQTEMMTYAPRDVLLYHVPLTNRYFQQQVYTVFMLFVSVRMINVSKHIQHMCNIVYLFYLLFIFSPTCFGKWLCHYQGDCIKIT
jgi:hypothetical protein